MAFGSASAPGNRICVPFQREKRNYSGPTLPLVAASFSMGLILRNRAQVYAQLFPLGEETDACLCAAFPFFPKAAHKHASVLRQPTKTGTRPPCLKQPVSEGTPCWTATAPAHTACQGQFLPSVGTPLFGHHVRTTLTPFPIGEIARGAYHTARGHQQGRRATQAGDPGAE